MRRIHPDGWPRLRRGFTLLEMVVTIVVLGIIVGATIYFAYPLRGAVDVSTRAELTDTADNALQRIARDVRLALPNSVRRDGSHFFLEFIPVRSAGRYRVSSSTAVCDTGTDELAFDAADTCFKSIGTLPDAATILAGDHVVLNNYGAGFSGQNAYETSDPLNRRRITTAANEGSRERIVYTPSTAFDRTLHDSPAKRFYIAVGNTTTLLPEPVTYECSPTSSGGTGTLTRRWGYTMLTSQPTAPAQFTTGTGTSAVIASDVTACDFDYDPNGVGPQVGLLTLRLTLGKTLSGGQTESVTLYHSIHVSNVP